MPVCPGVKNLAVLSVIFLSFSSVLMTALIFEILTSYIEVWRWIMQLNPGESMGLAEGRFKIFTLAIIS